MGATALILARVEARQNGPNRWRCACPVCGAGNRSTLSIGTGDNGCVLLKCWKEGCSPDAIAAAVGLTIDDLFPPRDGIGTPSLPRRQLITSAQALEVLEEELTLAWVVLSDLHAGLDPTDQTRARVLLGLARVVEIRSEVQA